ncbi:MAG TPA: DUF2889 domain-containing protein [Ilumatobacter sp.]
MSVFATDGILPPPPDGGTPVLHDREYRVRAFRLGDDRILIQGALRDQKPPRLYLQIDPDPLTVHHMQVSIEVSCPELEIVDVTTHFETHPREECPTITGHYDHLVGLSISRGFTHRVRELFGGPRGCTHTTALLQAMAPVAVQCFWSMRAVAAKLAGQPDPILDPQRDQDQSWRLNVNSCHVWREDGPAVAAREAGVSEPAMVSIRPRLEKFGTSMPNGTPSDDRR